MTGKKSDEITGKARNKMRQVRTHTWAWSTSHKLKSLQDLSIRVNSKMTKEVMHHVGLRVDGGLHLRLHVCKVIHPMLESSDPFHRLLSLVLTYRSKGAYQLGYLAEVEVPAQSLGLGNCERGSNYHPHGDPSSHPHTQCPTGAPKGESVV
jgi:hypothetical protein